MIDTLMIVHGIISILLIISVLLQFGKGAEAGLVSGGVGDSVMTSSQRGNLLSKLTTVLAVLFMASSVFLARLQSSSNESSLLDGEAPVARPLNSDAQAPRAEAPKKTEAPKTETTPTTTK